MDVLKYNQTQSVSLPEHVPRHWYPAFFLYGTFAWHPRSICLDDKFCQPAGQCQFARLSDRGVYSHAAAARPEHGSLYSDGSHCRRVQFTMLCFFRIFRDLVYLLACHFRNQWWTLDDLIAECGGAVLRPSGSAENQLYWI